MSWEKLHQASVLAHPSAIYTRQLKNGMRRAYWYETDSHYDSPLGARVTEHTKVFRDRDGHIIEWASTGMLEAVVVNHLTDGNFKEPW